MFMTILSWVLRVVPVIPSLVTDIENLWRGKPAAGQAKWQAVEQALSQSIQDVTAEITAIAPAGSKPADISKAISIFAKDVNDTFVKLMNDLKLFGHGGQPPATTPPPAV